MMSEFYKFAGEHPILTVILASMIIGGVIRLFRGYNPHGDDT